MTTTIMSSEMAKCRYSEAEVILGALNLPKPRGKIGARVPVTRRIRHYSRNGRQSSCSVKAGSQHCVLLTTENSLDKGAHWDAGATYEVTLDLIFTRARVLQYLREQFYTLSTSNGGVLHCLRFFEPIKKE